MDTIDKLSILADAAKYDVSCASSGVTKKNNSGIGNSISSGICHTWTSDGRCVSLLKVLLTNNCIYDCKYCLNRKANDIPRASFSPEEIASLTFQFYKRNYIEGLFLSSAVERNPNYTMEKIYQTIFLLRNKYQFNGYVHVKAIPGADLEYISKLGYIVDRMSINLELPSEQSLQTLAPDKNMNSLLNPINYIANNRQLVSNKRLITNKFIPAGQSTQFIVGASNDSDYALLEASEQLYNSYNLKRVYYSAYIPINEDGALPMLTTTPPLKRENRLYQADWLLRFYHFKSHELLNKKNPFFDEDLDPKMCWALRNLDFFPVEVNTASLKTLLRVPGIGPKNAQRIVRERKAYKLSYENLKKMRVALNRAKYFITCHGKYNSEISLNAEKIKFALLNNTNKGQMTIWNRK